MTFRVPSFDAGRWVGVERSVWISGRRANLTSSSIHEFCVSFPTKDLPLPWPLCDTMARLASALLAVTTTCASALQMSPARTRRLAGVRPATTTLAASASASDVFGSSTLAVAETGAANDPFLIGLALASSALFVFVLGSVIFLTAKEQLSKKEINEEGTKPRLPTMAELGDDDDSSMAAPTPVGGNVNRRARRENAKLMKKPPPKLGDSSRF